MNIDTLVNNIVTAVAGSVTVKAWTNETYSKDHTVYKGVNTRKPPTEANYPLVHVFPGTKNGGYDLSGQGHQVAVTVGLYQDDEETTGNIIKMKGLAELEAYRKLVETAVLAAVTDMECNRLEIEYDPIEFFPYFLAGMTFTWDRDYAQGDDVFE